MHSPEKERKGRLVTLAELPSGRAATLEEIDLPGPLASRLMELGFLPGTEIVAGHRAPLGGPRVYRVDGTEVALRRDMAKKLRVRLPEGRP